MQLDENENSNSLGKYTILLLTYTLLVYVCVLVLMLLVVTNPHTSKCVVRAGSDTSVAGLTSSGVTCARVCVCVCSMVRWFTQRSQWHDWTLVYEGETSVGRPVIPHRRRTE